MKEPEIAHRLAVRRALAGKMRDLLADNVVKAVVFLNELEASNKEWLKTHASLAPVTPLMTLPTTKSGSVDFNAL